MSTDQDQQRDDWCWHMFDTIRGSEWPGDQGGIELRAPHVQDLGRGNALPRFTCSYAAARFG